MNTSLRFSNFSDSAILWLWCAIVRFYGNVIRVFFTMFPNVSLQKDSDCVIIGTFRYYKYKRLVSVWAFQEFEKLSYGPRLGEVNQ